MCSNLAISSRTAMPAGGGEAGKGMHELCGGGAAGSGCELWGCDPEMRAGGALDAGQCCLEGRASLARLACVQGAACTVLVVVVLRWVAAQRLEKDRDTDAHTPAQKWILRAGRP